MTKDSFLGNDYKAPQGNYLKLQDGENTFRVVGSAITGYEYWNGDNKPVRQKDEFISLPKDIRKDEDGNPSKIKHFWAFPVWNYDALKVQIMEITQKTVQDAILALVKNKKWGDPKGYDITITRSGTGFDTTYQVMPNPHAELPMDVKEAVGAHKLRLEALYEGADPFLPETVDKLSYPEMEGEPLI